MAKDQSDNMDDSKARNVTAKDVRGGETVGGVSGAVAGAAIGALGGPIGAIIGGIAGAGTGWWTGRAATEAAGSLANGNSDSDSYYKNHYSAGTAKRTRNSTASSYDRARPAYQLGHLAGLNPDYQDREFDAIESDLQRGWNAQSSTDRADWNDVRDYARDAYTRGREQRLVLSEEQLDIGKRQVQSGEVNLRKTVETRHVEEQVGLMHEEIEIERRPLAGADGRDVEIGEQVIRVPLMAEEAVVGKKTVGTEEVIVRKKAVTENQTVEADVRKERLVTDGLDQDRGKDAKR